MRIKLIVSPKRNTATIDIISDNRELYVYVNYGYSVYKFTLEEWYKHCIIGNK